ncbi:uncharacterized protein LOC143056828 isoform X2 [Mytilus galloprovincialis]|uniref:uncharacterized protein LOC143056828 isoform X2 n=1 Tax=Mytilus galloprovincialis TaxID=29158 RepID=UPI003F7B5453
MWVCSTCYKENSVANGNCSECHKERPQSRNSKVDGYKLQRRDRTDHGGGLATFMRADIPARRRLDIEYIPRVRTTTYGSGSSKTKPRGELGDNMVPEQSTTDHNNHTVKLSTPITATAQTTTIQTAVDGGESKHTKPRRKNVLDTIARKPSGSDTYNIEGVSANDILKFVITTFENGCTFEDFSLQCDLFPSSVDIPRWFESHAMQFHIFKNNEKIEYILPYVKTAGICTQYNNPHVPGKCNRDNCRFLHVCRRFVRHIYCNFKGCRLVHDFTNPDSSRLIAQFGLDNFSENQIKRILNNQFPSICWDYNFNEKCKVGTKKCVNLHLCGSYKFGKCEEPCKFKRTHKLNKDHNKRILRAFEMMNWPAEKVLKNIYVPPKRVPSCPSNAKGDSDHNKNIDDDDDDLYKGSDFIDMDESLVPPKADSSDDNSDEDESDELSI